MPDIKLTCQCGREVTLSEYAKPESRICPSCGTAIAIPGTPESDSRSTSSSVPSPAESDARASEPTSGDRAKPSLAKRPRTGKRKTVLPADAPVSTVRAEVVPSTRRVRRAQPTVFSAATISLLILLLVGIPLAWYRYSGRMDPTTLESLFHMGYEWGPWALLIVHVLIIINAFHDEFFQGILSIMVPLYSFSYLYIRSDNHYLRVGFALFLILFAPGTYDGAADYANLIYHKASAWIGQYDHEAGFE